MSSQTKETTKVQEESNKVEFPEWQKLDLRVGKILSVEDVAGADKLYKLVVKADRERTLLAGLKKHYTKEELIGKRCVVFCNLTPRMMKGITSEGMILAAVSENESQIALIQPNKETNEGLKVEFNSEYDNYQKDKSSTIKIEEFSRINFRVGKILETREGITKVSCQNKIFETKTKLYFRKGDKLAIIIEGDNIVIPFVNDSTTLTPEKDIPEGSKIR